MKCVVRCVLAALVSVAACQPIPSPSGGIVSATPAWQLVFADNTDPNIGIADVAHTDDSFVAVGTDASGLRVWVSQNATDWRVVEADNIDLSGGLLVPHAIATRGSESVIFGEDQRGSTIALMVWLSTDSTSWAAIDSPAFHAPGNLAAADITWTGQRFVAVGSEPRPEVVAPEAVVLVSQDGRSWNRIRDSDLVSDSGLAMHAVVASSGSVIAFGSESPSGTAVLESQDGGLTWSRTSPVALAASTVEAAADSSKGLILGGCETTNPDQPGQTQAAVWIAPNGPSGQITVHQLDDSGGRSCVWSVDATPRGLLAGGFVDDRLVAWQSADGSNWERATLPESMRLHDGHVRGVTHSPTVDLIVADGRSDDPGPVFGSSLAGFWAQRTRP